MRRRFQALIQHRGEGKRRGGTRRGSVGDTDAGGGGAEAALNMMAVGRMGGAVALDRRRETTRVGLCWAERLL
jgi:hypothetical protein